MRLPAPLLRQQTHVHKNHFGHLLVVAGSRRMLGAACLVAHAAIKSGAGLVTAAVPESLNHTLQAKLNPEIMTLPLACTDQETFSPEGLNTINEESHRFSAMAIGPGLTTDPQTVEFVKGLLINSRMPVVLDADGINALKDNPGLLNKMVVEKVLTPHVGEMSRLTRILSQQIEEERDQIVKDFALSYKCTMVLKGPATVVASVDERLYHNQTGNPGMATAGSGDCLTGMIGAFLAQGIDAYAAAVTAVHLHGLAGDMAARKFSRVAMTASDLIGSLSDAFQLFDQDKDVENFEKVDEKKC